MKLKVKGAAKGFEFWSATLDYAMKTGRRAGLRRQFAVAKAAAEPGSRMVNASSHSTASLPSSPTSARTTELSETEMPKSIPNV